VPEPVLSIRDLTVQFGTEDGVVHAVNGFMTSPYPTLAGPNIFDSKIEPLEKSKAEWRQLLPEAAFEVLFEERTERRGTSPLESGRRLIEVVSERFS
jgi:hypothetical protein